MSTYETLTLVSYFFVLSILGIYGWHRYFIVYQYMKNKDRVPGPPPEMTEWPVVTVQLPIFNEMYVVDRLIDSICELDYPQDKLEIQVLDDSTDETRQIAELAVRRYAQRGFDIKYIHRVDRTGFKAGALDAALKVARGEFIAIFDADFVPSSDFLKRTVPYFSTDDKLAVVYDFISFDHGHSFAVKVYMSRSNPHVPTVCDLWPAANWHEREAFDMMGITFDSHPDFRRILLPED